MVRIIFSFSQGVSAALVFIAVISGCSRIPQQELQAAVDPLATRNYPLAIEKLSQLLEQYPKNAQVNYYLAFAYMQNRDHKSALYFLRQTLGIQKRYKAVIGDVKMANFLAGNSQNTREPFFRLAVLESQKIIASNPETEISDRVRLHLAYYYLWKQDYSTAIETFKKVIDAPPDDTEHDISARLMIGNILLRYLDDEEEGLKSYRYLADHYPVSNTAAEALFLLAEYNENKMRVYNKRYQALQEFASAWKNDSILRREAQSARKQSQQDIQSADVYRSKAADAYRKILDGYDQSAFYARAKTQLDRL